VKLLLVNVVVLFVGSLQGISQSVYWASLWGHPQQWVGGDTAPQVSAAAVLCQKDGRSHERPAGEEKFKSFHCPSFVSWTCWWFV